MNESIALAYNDTAAGGSSDKVYHVALEKMPAGESGLSVELYSVTAQYGRRGSALVSQKKASNVTYAVAKKTYTKLVAEKIAKGYMPQGVAPAPQVAPSGAAVDVKPPELLEEITTPHGAEPFVHDPNYWMQDKSDGVSRGVVKQRGEIFGINKRGVPVPLPAELVAELERVKLDTFQIDAELVGNKLICRDLLVADQDISLLPYYQRFAILQELIGAIVAGTSTFQYVQIVQTWVGDEKATALENSRAARREGVVFKLIRAPYRPGRNGQHKKYKFIKTLSAIAGKPRDKGKESVELFLYDGDNLCEPRNLTPLKRCGTVSLIGKAAFKEGAILEVAYLYAMPGGLMQQARILSVRDDVDAQDCTTDQLIYKREEEEV